MEKTRGADDEETQEWGEDLLVLVVGTILGMRPNYLETILGQRAREARVSNACSEQKGEI